MSTNSKEARKLTREDFKQSHETYPIRKPKVYESPVAPAAHIIPQADEGEKTE